MDRITIGEETMKTRRRVFLSLAAATTIGLTVAMPRLSQVVAQQSIVQGQSSGGRFESSPQTAGPGSTIFNRSIDPCPPSPTGGTTTVVVPPYDPGSGRFTITPSAGPPGSTFQAQSLDRCPPVGSSTNPRAIVTFFGQSGVTSSNVARIDGSGQWGPVSVVVPPGAAGGAATVYATC